MAVPLPQLIAVVALYGWAASLYSHPHHEEHPPILAVSSPIIAEISYVVAGEDAVVKSLVSIGHDPRSFQPTKATQATLATADLLIEIGSGFEPWLAAEVEKVNPQLHRLVLSHTIQLVPMPGPDEEQRDEVRSLNPLIWNDPLNGGHIAMLIADALTELDPDSADAYETRAVEFAVRMRQLDEEFTRDFSTLESSERRLLTEDWGMSYFARRYGLELVVAPLRLNAGKENAGPDRMKDLIRLVEVTQVRAVFPTSDSDPFVGQISEKTGIPCGAPLYPMGLSGPDGPPMPYEQSLRYHAETILNGLRGE